MPCLSFKGVSHNEVGASQHLRNYNFPLMQFAIT